MVCVRFCKYHPRCFHSKGALLVLLWSLLVSVTVVFVAFLYASLFMLSDIIMAHSWYWTALFPFFAFLLSAPLSGWLADVRFGRYKIFKVGTILLFISAMCCSGYIVAVQSLSLTTANGIVGTLLSTMSCVGIGMCLITTLQLGLDQMPDASSSNITSYIAWLWFSSVFGIWFGDFLFRLAASCVDNSFQVTSTQVLSLVPAACMAVVLVSDSLLSSKWLVVEPKSPKSLKTIYHVVKFAARHKAPINRSALTYWESDIPSRLDLGKSKYGGPFTTEEVEDVKTFLKLFTVTLPLWTVSVSLAQVFPLYTVTPAIEVVPSPCLNFVFDTFTTNPWWCVIVGTLIYEFIVYPFIRYRLPSILKRIGIVFLCLVLFNMAFLLYHICVYYDVTVFRPFFIDIQLILYTFSVSSHLTSSLELVCAQAPYSMRGLFSGYIFLVFVTALPVSIMFNFVNTWVGSNTYSVVVISSVKFVVTVVGFVLHCFLARWYKRRVRDDGYVVQTVVEEVYDRYLSAPS